MFIIVHVRFTCRAYTHKLFLLMYIVGNKLNWNEIERISGGIIKRNNLYFATDFRCQILFTLKCPSSKFWRLIFTFHPPPPNLLSNPDTLHPLIHLWQRWRIILTWPETYFDVKTTSKIKIDANYIYAYYKNCTYLFLHCTTQLNLLYFFLCRWPRTNFHTNFGIKHLVSTWKLFRPTCRIPS